MPGVTGGPVNIADHRSLAQDDLRDGPIQNIAFYLGQAPLAGSLAAGTRYTNTGAVAIAATETLVVAIPLTLPATVYGQTVAGTLQVGSRIQFWINGTYTSAGAQTASFALRAGTNGTTADTSVGTLYSVTTAASGTAQSFSLFGGLTIRTLGTSGTLVGEADLSNQGTTGIFTATFGGHQLLASSTINTVTATFLDITMTAGTSNSASITDYIIQVMP